MIYSQTFEIPKCEGEQILDRAMEFFRKTLKSNQEVIRWAVVGVKGKRLIIEASIMEVGKI
ncbi:MAG: hypothetical protein QXP39_03270 [Candidatus Aenigmatarchaeota archaeon]